MAGLKKMPGLKAPSTARTKAGVRAPAPTKAQGRPPLLERPVLRPRGPEVLGLGVKPDQLTIGEAPSDFEGSLPEWVWHFVSRRKLNPEMDPRQPPYVGDGVTWWFQVPEIPDAPRSVGFSVSDFVYAQSSGFIIVRIQGFHWHVETLPAVQARDAYLAGQAANESVRVESVEDFEFMDDPTGGKAGKLLAEILSGRSFVGAIHGGIARPPRYAKFV